MFGAENKTSRRRFLSASGRAGVSVATTLTPGASPAPTEALKPPVPEAVFKYGESVLKRIELACNFDFAHRQQDDPIDFVNEIATLSSFGDQRATQLARSIQAAFDTRKTTLIANLTTAQSGNVSTLMCAQWVALTKPAALKGWWGTSSHVIDAIVATDALPGHTAMQIAELSLTQTPEALLDTHRAHIASRINGLIATCSTAAKTAGVDLEKTPFMFHAQGMLNGLVSPEAMGAIGSEPVRVLWNATLQKTILPHHLALRHDVESRLFSNGMIRRDFHAISRDVSELHRSFSTERFFSDSFATGQELGAMLRTANENAIALLVSQANDAYIANRFTSFLGKLSLTQEQRKALIDRFWEMQSISKTELSSERDPQQLDQLFSDNMQEALKDDANGLTPELRRTISEELKVFNMERQSLAVVSGTHSEYALACRLTDIANQKDLDVQIEFRNGRLTKLSWEKEGMTEELSRVELASIFKTYFFLFTLPRIINLAENPTRFCLHIPGHISRDWLVGMLKKGDRSWCDTVVDNGVHHVYIIYDAYLEHRTRSSLRNRRNPAHT